MESSPLKIPPFSTTIERAWSEPSRLPSLENFYRPIAIKPRRDVACDFRFLHFDWPDELTVAALLDDETLCLDRSENLVARFEMNFRGSDESAAQFALHVGDTAGDAGGGTVSLCGDVHLALGLHTAAKRPRDFEIAQVDIAPAMRAEGGLRRTRDVLLMPARKARHVAKSFARDELRQLLEEARAFEACRLLGQQLLDAVVLPTFSAEGGLRVG